MPMFHTPKPRQFTYRPRFYDPEKERWEALKYKYSNFGDGTSSPAPTEDMPTESGDADLEYFQRRVRDLDREARQKGLTWKDAFRKREMPTFNYQPRFAEGESQDTGEHLNEFKKKGAKIKRRFDVSDTDYMKPIPASRIIIYTLLVCLLLYWILF